MHIDLAVNRSDFPFIKKNFNPIKKRRFLYIGHTALYKNFSLLERLAEKLPDIEFAWIGGKNPIKLYEVAQRIGSKSIFSGSIDNQIISKEIKNAPEARNVINFILK